MKAGSRVRFVASLQSLLTYDKAPEHGSYGTVVLLKTAMGRSTDLNGRVAVIWDNTGFMPVYSKHLHETGKQDSKVASVVSDIRSLASSFMMGSTSDELVHKATQDLWSVTVATSGEVVVERLFDESGEPLKV